MIRNKQFELPSSTTPRSSDRSWLVGFFMLAFCLFWSGITLWFDVMLAKAIGQQINAQLAYKAAAATITASKVVTHDSSEGDTHGPGIDYTYAVDGREYAGSRYSYFEMHTGGNRAQRIVGQYKRGSQAVVFYDPQRPAESTLTVGVDPIQLYALLFLTPFNLIMLTMWWFAVQALRKPQPKPLNGHLAFDDGFEAIVRFSFASPLCAGLVVFGLVPFLLTFVLAFGFNLDPPMPVAVGAVAISVAAALGAGWRQHRAIQAGRYDLRINRSLKQIALPRKRGETEPRTLRFKDVVDFEIQLTPGETPTYTLEMKSSNDSFVLATGLDQENATNLRDWLRKQVGDAGARMTSAVRGTLV